MLQHLIGYAQAARQRELQIDTDGSSKAVTTTADVWVETYDQLTGEPLEILKFRATITGSANCFGEASEPEVESVECYECGLSPETRRKPGEHEGVTLCNRFYAMLDNDEGWFDGESDQIKNQLRSALKSALDDDGYRD